MSAEKIETVVIGGGQAGLSTSYHLGRLDREHVVLEQAEQAGNAWRNGRWDSFTLVTPNWTFQLPGAEYHGAERDAFMPRDKVVARFERYVADNQLPVRFGVRATAVDRVPTGVGYLVTTDAGAIEAANVVIAVGQFQQPKRLPLSSALPAEITQIHSGQYRNPGALTDGAVLVVGSAQSGCQIAQELYQHGRRVYLCIGGAGRVPRRYRGRDIVDWMNRAGLLDRVVDDLPSPRAKFAGNPHVSGRDGGQNLNLHQFARDGVVLLGHLQGAEGPTIRLAPDRDESLAKADAFEAQLVQTIDAHIEQEGIDAPLETLPALRDGFDAPEVLELDLTSVGVTTAIWAMGYSFDFSWVHLPVLDGDGFPIQRSGVTEYPGLYFVGLPWMPKWKSGLLAGVGEAAELVAERIAAR